MRTHRSLALALPLFAALPFAVVPLHAQQDVKTVVLKHLKTSRDFTLEVAAAMPEADYGFKLTAPQMSFAQQITHLSQGMFYFLSPFTGSKGDAPKPKSNSKADILAFVKQSYDDAMAEVSKLTPEQLSKTYKSEAGTSSGTDLLIGMLDHCTHHRASAEMYLRVKGITPPEYKY